MINRIVLTAGDLTIKKGKEYFSAQRGGDDFQFYIEFDNGSALGYCKIDNIQATIDKTIFNFENAPDRSQY